jgi:thiol-disulfide isomerase/thioredoxin
MVALAGVVALVALLAYGLASKGDQSTIDAQLRAGKRPAAPDVSLQQLDGGGANVKLASYKGKVVVLNFWASWCTPCRTETPLLERWHRKLSDSGATVVGVDVLDVEGDARGFIKEFKLTYPQLRDADGQYLGDFDVLQYPETVVLDRDGRIAATRRGPVDDRFFTDEVVPLTKEEGRQ